MKRRKRIGIISMLFLGIALILTSCGGGGGGDGTTPAYTIGGTVSGLSGTLALQNNGGDDLTISADGASFIFNTALADGSTYNVTVKTQPDGQTCTVSNNAGTISGDDVTDVTVTCSVDTYTVGGTVNGLSGTLVLQNNGGDDLQITSDGAFTFSTALADGAGYNVTVKTQPAGQTCIVINGSGTISSADVTDVSVNCTGKAWTNPTSLADNISPDGQGVWNPQVAMDDNGNAVIVWSQSDGSNSQIFKSEYRKGTWTNPSSLTDNISPDGTGALWGSPQVAMDDNGNAVIVWSQSDGSYDQIFKSEYRKGTWTNPSSLADNISPNGGEVGWFPQVAMDDNGNAVIVWQQYDGNGYYQIFKSEYRKGVWTNPSSLADNISPNGGEAWWNPQVAMDDNGNAVIVWSQSDGSNWQIFKSEYRNGIWTNPASLADNISPDGQGADGPQVAMDDNGNAVIVWKQYDGSNYQIFKSEYRKGVWTNPSSLSDNISPNGGEAWWFPQVAMDDNGNAVIVWERRDDSGWQVFKSEYRNGAWTNPASLADNISPDGEGVYYPQVAMDDNGNAVIVWEQYDGSGNYQVFKSEYR